MTLANRTSLPLTKTTTSSLAFDLLGTIVGRHEHDQRTRRLISARILAGDVIGEGGFDPGLPRPVGAYAGSPGSRPYSTREHVNKHISGCRHAVQDRRSARRIIDEGGGKHRIVQVWRPLKRHKRDRGFGTLRVIGGKQRSDRGQVSII